MAYQSSPEPIASIPPVHTDLSQTNRFTDYFVPPYAATYNSYGAVPNNDYLQQTLYTQPNHAPHTLNNFSANVQRPNDSYFNQILENIREIWQLCLKKLSA